MRYLLVIFEAIFSPITRLFKISFGNTDLNRVVKPVLVVLITIIAVLVLILIYYREYLFA